VLGQVQMNVQVNPAAVHAQLADGAVIMNVETGIYYGLDPIGSRIWTLIERGTPTSAIVDTLEAEYAVEPDRLKADVEALLQALAAKGLVNAAA
jgi:Coenzyme PQQ synthesis protein D (PqqD)